MSDHLTDLFKILAIDVIEGGQLLTVDIKHGGNLAIRAEHGYDNF